MPTFPFALYGQEFEDELKNLNSFSTSARVFEYEVERQRRIFGVIIRQKPLWWSANKSTILMRVKEGRRITVLPRTRPTTLWNLRWVDWENAYRSCPEVSKRPSYSLREAGSGLSDMMPTNWQRRSHFWLLWSSCGPWWWCQSKCLATKRWESRNSWTQKVKLWKKSIDTRKAWSGNDFASSKMERFLLDCQESLRSLGEKRWWRAWTRRKAGFGTDFRPWSLPTILSSQRSNEAAADFKSGNGMRTRRCRPHESKVANSEVALKIACPEVAGVEEE